MFGLVGGGGYIKMMDFKNFYQQGAPHWMKVAYTTCWDQLEKVDTYNVGDFENCHRQGVVGFAKYCNNIKD